MSSPYCTICIKKNAPAKKKAIFHLPAHKYDLCREHYKEWFLRRINWTVKNFQMGNSFLVALSGGLDSSVLCHSLKLAGFNVRAIHVDLGNGAFSVKSRKAAERISGFCGVELKLLKPDKSLGEILSRTGRNPCATCSEIRNALLNREARESGIPFATGHHLDDETAAIFGGVYSWNPDILSRRTPIVSGLLPGFGKKVKPLCLFSKEELSNWAKLFKLPYLKKKCNFSKEPKTEKWQAILSSAEKREPGFRLKFYLSYLSKGQPVFAPLLGKETRLCPSCGREPTSGKLCAFCRYFPLQ
ncbi:MAG: ATP-binding protein [archaeon]